MECALKFFSDSAQHCQLTSILKKTLFTSVIDHQTYRLERENFNFMFLLISLFVKTYRTTVQLVLRPCFWSKRYLHRGFCYKDISQIAPNFLFRWHKLSTLCVHCRAVKYFGEKKIHRCIMCNHPFFPVLCLATRPILITTEYLSEHISDNVMLVVKK